MVFLLCILLVVFLPIPAPWDIVLIVVGGVLEVVELVVLSRWSRRLARDVPVAAGPEAMLGETGEVVAPCSPRGKVRIQGELWDARCDSGAAVGDAVQVDGLEDLVLVVSPASRRARRSLRRGGAPSPAP